MSSWADAYLSATATALSAAADPERAAPMRAYMKDRFAFLGVAAAPRRRVVRDATRDLGAPPNGDELARLARSAWQVEEREFQYVAADALRRWVQLLGAGHLDEVGQLIVSRSWWDTVDVLAARVVGPMVSSDPTLVPAMDLWIDDPELWLRRAALLHQLGYKASTDADRLFGYCLLRSAEADFFIRKGIGWALREYAKTDPEAVWKFVDLQRDRFAPLTIREATKHRPPGT